MKSTVFLLIVLLTSFTFSRPRKMFREFNIKVIENTTDTVTYKTAKCYVGIDAYLTDLIVNTGLLIPSVFYPIGGYLETHNGIITSGAGFRSFFKTTLEPVRAITEGIALSMFTGGNTNNKYVKFIDENGDLIVITGKDFIIEEATK